MAIKLLLPGLRSDAVVRFQNEARTAAKLNHPNILQVFDFGATEKGDLYLIMDYIDGMSLEDVVQKQLEFNLATLIDIFCQISDGLEHAHARGVLHRDIKPSNVMIARSGYDRYQVKIVDFGLAKLEADEQRLTTTRARVGSPLYMSPEQARGEDVDCRSDIYSMGALMFALLTGTPPIRGETYMETIARQIDEKPPLLNDFIGSQKYPRSLERLIERSLQKQPSERFQTAGELHHALLLVQEEELSKPCSSDKHQSVSSGRSLLPASGMLVAACLVISCAIAFFQANRQHEPEDTSYQLHMLEHHKWLIASGDVHNDLSALSRQIRQCAGVDNETRSRL